jgi:hypothetical protein
MSPENLCPVCGYEMEAPAKNYRICASCGTEFGLHDANASIADLRDAWMETGPAWWSKTDRKPDNWDPITQMQNAGIVVKRPITTEAVAIGTASASRTIGGRDWKGWVAASGQLDDKLRAMVCD